MTSVISFIAAFLRTEIRRDKEGKEVGSCVKRKPKAGRRSANFFILPIHYFNNFIERERHRFLYV